MSNFDGDEYDNLLNTTNRNILNYHKKNEGVMFTNDDIARFMIEQGSINKSLADTMQSLATDMTEIKKSMKNQEVLLEKLSNLENKIEDNNKRVHKRIDIIERDSKDNIKEVKSYLDKVVQELKDEQITPINNSLDWAWKFIFSKMFVLVIALITTVYQLVIKT